MYTPLYGGGGSMVSLWGVCPWYNLDYPYYAELQLASYEIEPPEHPGEKKRYQELK